MAIANNRLGVYTFIDYGRYQRIYQGLAGALEFFLAPLVARPDAGLPSQATTYLADIIFSP